MITKPRWIQKGSYNTIVTILAVLRSKCDPMYNAKIFNNQMCSDNASMSILDARTVNVVLCIAQKYLSKKDAKLIL
jgi:hypothetical protein